MHLSQSKLTEIHLQQVVKYVIYISHSQPTSIIVKKTHTPASLQTNIFVVLTSKNKEYQKPDPKQWKKKKNSVNLKSRNKEVGGAYLPKDDIAFLTNETHGLKRKTSKHYQKIPKPVYVQSGCLYYFSLGLKYVKSSVHSGKVDWLHTAWG